MAEEDNKPEQAPEETAPESESAASPEPEDEKQKEPEISTFQMLKIFLDETNVFLNKYDDLVEERAKHLSVFLHNVNDLRETLVTLLQRYILHTMVKEDFLYKHIKCCGEEILNNEEFEEHYVENHQKADEAVSLPELNELKAYTRTCKTYIEKGKAMNNELIFSLKRLLRKSNTVLHG